MSGTVVLHIGTHKTGSTSLQQFLRDHRDGLLAATGAAYPTGMVIPASHAELPLLVIRPTRTWPARLRFPETQRRPWLAAADTHIRDELRCAAEEVVILSHEDLSYVRFDDELDRLRDLLSPRTVKVVVFLRERTAFLSSYREQLEAMAIRPSEDPCSFAYTAEDSWLVDYPQLVDVFRRGFGADNVEVLDYDAVLASDGSVIPAFADLLGIRRSSLPTLDPYFLNRRGQQLVPSDESLRAIRARLARQGG